MPKNTLLSFSLITQWKWNSGINQGNESDTQGSKRDQQEGLQKGGILVWRILEISVIFFWHFRIVAANLNLFFIKRLQRCWFMTQLNSKWRKLRRKQPIVQFYAPYYGKSQQIHNSDIFCWKSGYRTKKSLFATLRARWLGREISQK